MERENYLKIVNKHKPKESVFKNAILSFLVGGFVGLLGEIIIELYVYIFNIPTSQASIFMIVTLIFLGCLFTCLGFFDDLVHKARCGLIIPITGFAHAMMSAALEFRKEGMINGIGANLFKLAGSVIIFGVVSAYAFGLIRYIIFGA